MLAANEQFYAAFEARDLDAMSDVWARGDAVTCVHPGWGLLRGWGAVAGSWLGIFSGPQHLQFVLTDVVADVDGDTGWVSAHENLLDGPEIVGTTAALNVFRRLDGRWRLVAHHASSVVPGAPTSPGLE